MALKKLSRDEGAIRVDYGHWERALHKYRLAAALDAVGEDGGQIDCSFGFDCTSPGWEPVALVATLIAPVGSSFVIGADDKLSEDDTTGLFFILKRDEEGEWVVGDQFYRFTAGEITEMDDRMAAEVFLALS